MYVCIRVCGSCKPNDLHYLLPSLLKFLLPRHAHVAVVLTVYRLQTVTFTVAGMVTSKGAKLCISRKTF